MTTNSYNTGPEAAFPRRQAGLRSIDDLDLTPAGLSDAPANEQDPDSMVHTGNS